MARIRDVLAIPLKWAFKAAFWICAFIIVSAVIIYETVDVNFMKSKIETVATQFLQEQMKINGDVNLGFDVWRPSIVLHDVSVGDPHKSNSMQADRVEVDIPVRRPDPENPWTFFARLQNLRVNGHRAGDYAVPIHFEDDGFNIPRIHASLDNGTLTGKLSYLKSAFHTELEVKGVDYDEVAKGIRGGNTQARIVLDSKGTTAEQIRHGLHGHISVLGEKGSLDGDAIDVWAEDLLSMVLSNREKETTINCAVADFDVVNGIATSKTIIIDTDRVTIFGKGNINIGTGQVDLSFTPKPKNNALLSLATTVDVTGPIDNLHVAPDRGAILEKIGSLFLTTVSLPAGLIPLLQTGTGVHNPCLKYLKPQKS